jgi:tetratricopeptide (TPR) repeat protein
MNLRITIFQKRCYVKFLEAACFREALIKYLCGFLLFSAVVPAHGFSQASRKPVLIRDTSIAEGREPEPEQAKEPDPARSKENLDIGNMYLKRRNYSAAISRYIEAIAWLESSIPAHEALARAYERNGDFAKAIQTLEAVIEKNPDSRKNKGFQTKITSLRKKLR